MGAIYGRCCHCGRPVDDGGDLRGHVSTADEEGQEEQEIESIRPLGKPETKSSNMGLETVFEEAAWSAPPIVRNQTYAIINAQIDAKDKGENDISKSLDDASAQSTKHTLPDPLKTIGRVSTDGSTSQAASLKNKAVCRESLLAQVAHLVDTEYDILTADMLLSELEAIVDGEADWDSILDLPVIHRFKRKLHYFHEVGKACCNESEDWFQAFSNDTGTQTIHGCFDEKDKSILHYRVRIQIPAKLTNVMAIANEIDLMPTWNTLVSNVPETIGRRTAHYLVLNYQMSFLHGMYKLDVLNEVRRFTDTEGGFCAEYIETAGEDHPSYRKPKSGYKRPETKIKNVWAACGPDNTVLIQVGTLKLPFSVTKWLASTLGSVAGRFIIGGLIKNSLRSTEPGNPWAELLVKDKLGFYERLNQCVTAKGSEWRRPAKGSERAKASAEELSPYFLRQRIKRLSKKK